MIHLNAYAQLDKCQRYSYADYRTWAFSEWVELIDGHCRLFNSPGKTPHHQRTVSQLGQQIATHQVDPAFEVWSLPLPLILGYTEPGDSYQVVLPDVFMIRKQAPNYLDERGWHGVPDWIVEVTDVRTQDTDRTAKFHLYQYFGVKEYWIIKPESRQIDRFELGPNGLYQPVSEQDRAGQLLVQALPGLALDSNEIFR